MKNTLINKDLVIRVLHTTNLNIDPELLQDILNALQSPIPHLKLDYSL